MKTDHEPLVSIIVITYNCGKYVIETLESIKDQSYKNIELIVSDDGSSDNTVATCKEWISNNHERFIRTVLIDHPINTGIPANCNRGIKAAKGEWIKLIAGDDLFFPDAIENYISFLQKNKNCLVLHSKVNPFSQENLKYRAISDGRIDLKSCKINRPDITAQEQFQCLLRVNVVAAPTILFHRTVFDKVGYFDERLKLWEDRPMLLKITGNNIKLHYVDFSSVKYRVHDASVQISKDSSKLLSYFNIEKSKFYYKEYLKYLPPIERLINKLYLLRILALDRFKLNRNNLIIKLYLRITNLPFYYFLNKYEKNYK